MFAAVCTLPRLITLGKATPTRAAAGGSRATSPAMTGIRPSGVAGCGVAADINSPTSCPPSTSTSPALSDDPPTSIPSTSCVMAATHLVGGGRELHVALAPPLLITHPHRADRDPGRHDQHHDGSKRVDVRRHPEAHLRKDDHGQRTGTRARDELR